jgi:PAS domain S-box-containing protein
MLSAWYGGVGPGLLATLLGAAAGTLATWPAAAAGTAPGGAALVRLAVFLVEALVITTLAGALRGARLRAQRLAVREQAVRAEAESGAALVHALQRVSDAALTHLRLDDLLRELLGQVRESLSADTVVILLLTEDGTELEVRAAHGLEEEVRQGIRIPVGRGLAGRIAAEGRPLVFEDVAAEDVWSPVLRDKCLRALLGVPLVVEGRAIGVVHVGLLRPRRFGEEDTRLLQLVASRIAVAIDRARLYEAERAARAAAESAERRFRLLVDGVRDYAFLKLGPDGRVVSWNAGAERLEGYPAGEAMGLPLDAFYPPEVARAGTPARLLEQAAAEGRAEEEGWRLRRDGTRYWADVVVTALRDGEGRLFGFSVITRDLTERRRAAEVRARLLDQLITAQEEEQRRLARELHDDTGQSLTSLLVGLRALEDAAGDPALREQAAHLRRVTLRTLDEVRRLARGLRPGALDELGLAAALEHLGAETAQAHGIRVDVGTAALAGRRLPRTVEVALYRIVQEALTNAVKHGAARTVTVVARRPPGAVQAIVADDGCGFDAGAALRAPGAWTHLGLHGMRERAALLGGAVTIESTPGEGTTVYARLPLGEDGHGEDPGPDRG